MAEEEDFSALPLTDRWTHKNWKVRKEAYEAATKEFKTAQETDAIVRDFTADSALWKGAAADSNVAAQQEGLAALCAFLEIAGRPGCTRTRNDTITPIVEKGLIGRPAAKASALEALMLYVELDKPEPVIDELIPLLSHKLPKIVAATLSALTALFHAYGCKTIDPKPVLKQLPKMYGHADKNVRAEAQNLTIELYRWLKEGMKPLFWGDLKPVQQTDLEKLFEKTKDEPAPKQERLLRSQQAAKEAQAVAVDDGAEDGGEAEEAEIDLEPEYIAVDVFAKIPADLQERLASSKWKDRKEALDDLYAAVNVPAIEDGSFDDIVRSCAKCMKDANIQVVQVAANSIEALARGLKKKFAKYRNIVLGPMLERLKEKKQSVTDALAGACDGVFVATGLSDILEETLEFLKHKNPQVKLESTKFLTRSLKTTKDAPQIPEVKLIADAAKSLLGDSLAPTRDAAAEILGVLWKIMGDRNMLMHLEGLDDIRKTKIKEFCDSAEVKAKWKPKAAPAPAKAAAPAATKKAVPGKRPVSTVKKAAAAPPLRAPSPIEEAPAPLAARPTSRPGSKVAGSGRPSAVAAPGIKKPGLARPSSMMSPVRPRSVVEDTAPIAAPRGLPTPGRSLAARPLAKPMSESMTNALSPPPSPRGPVSTLSSAERVELSELRNEVELLRQQNSDLHTDKLRQQSQIHELQNQNAQLIEDHTRDMLSVKAKETQLVRARSDLDEADQRLHEMQREVERLRRQLSVSSGAMSPPLHSAGANGINGGGHSISERMTSSHEKAALMDDGKENSFPRELVLPQRLRDNTGSSQASLAGSTIVSRSRVTSPVNDDEVGTGGRHSPAGFHRPTARPLSGFAQHSQSALGQSAASSRTSSFARSNSGAGGEETWKRAAEVTQNLKARIELMKAKQAQRPH